MLGARHCWPLAVVGLLACTPNRVELSPSPANGDGAAHPAADDLRADDLPPEDLPPDEPEDAEDAEHSEPAPLPAALEDWEPLAWKYVQFAEAGFGLEVLDGEHSTRAWPRGGVLQQVLRLGFKDYALSILGA